MGERRTRMELAIERLYLMAQTDASGLFAEAAHQLAERQWQPIETAPRDGSDLLLWVERVTIGFFGGMSERWFDIYGHEITPTHWMPLPAGPEVDDEQ